VSARFAAARDATGAGEVFRVRRPLRKIRKAAFDGWPGAAHKARCGDGRRAFSRLAGEASV